MSISEITSKAKEIRELEALIEEAKAQAEAIKDEIKAYMGSEELLRAGEYTIRWQSVTSSRLDTNALKKVFSSDDLAPFTKTTVTRRFSIG